jgi:hypothetical protein
MKRAGRVLVSLFVLALLTLALAATCAWAARAYLTSRRAADKVAAQIAALYGGPIQLDSVDIGMDGSSLHDLRVYELDGGDQEPWLSVEHVRADVSVWDLLADDPNPASLELDGISLKLRFDGAGRLLTRIPPQTSSRQRPWPSLTLRNCTVTIQQQGRPELIVHGVEASLTPGQESFDAKGAVTDAYWGNWTLNAQIDTRTGRGESLLATERADVTMAKLRTIPFVSPNVWEQVQVEAQTPVQFRMRFDPAADSWKYRVELHPEQASVFVKAISLQSEQVGGGVVIEDGLVTLRELRGQTADGGIQTSAELDFRKPLREMTFSIGVNRVDIHRLPKAWRLPVLVGGRLTGEALLKVVIGGDPHVLTTGEGKGHLNGTLPVHMRANAAGFHFSL